ncbi:MAG TPA: hypothetical protein VFT66_25445 [Roseiflexaceae bacterium]|nr:hypothetical protein [Roseiflexaceae bacterium]
MLALFAIVVIVPLLYIPGFLIVHALLGPRQSLDPLERLYERTVAGTLLNGWLAFTLAELGVFSAWFHIAMLMLVCGAALLVARRRGASWPARPFGIVAGGRRAVETRRQGDKETSSGSDPLSIVHRLASFAYWDALALLAIGALFVVLVTPPFETVLGGRDAGVYANAGFAIARTGGIVQYDPLVAQIGQDQHAADPTLRAAAAQAETNFLGGQNPTRFIATRLRAAGFLIYNGDLAAGRVVPQGLHLFPAWIGLLASLLGFEGGLLATGLMGLLGVWSVGMLGRRLAGPWVGVLAALLLALNGVQVWFSRYSTSETTMQFLTFAGLYMFAVAAADERRTTNDEQPLVQRPASSVQRRDFAALLAGLAFGQLALARIDFILMVGPVLAYLFYVWLTGRWSRRETFLSIGLFAMLLHAAIHIATIARAYFFDTLFARLQDYAIPALLSLPFLTPELREVYLTRPCSPLSILRLPASPGTPACPSFKGMPPTEFVGWDYGRIAVEFAVVIVLIAAVLLLRPQIGRGLRHAERLIMRGRGALLLVAAAGIALLGAYGYFVRPQIWSVETLRGLTGCLNMAQLRAPTGACLALQGYIGAPIALPPGREVYTIPLANLVRVGWYLSPPGVLLAVAGFAWWWRRGLGRASWLFLTIGLVTSVFFIRQTYGTSDQTYIYILRRYVPQVYPVFCLAIAYALVMLGRWTMDDGRWKSSSGITFVIRHSSFVVSTVLTLALVGFLIMTNRAIYNHVEYGGSLQQLSAMAQRFDPNDVLLFRGGAPSFAAARDVPDIVTTPLTYAFGLNAITIKSSAPGKYADALATYIERWQSQGRNVYLVLGPSGAVGLPGFGQQQVGTLALDNLHEFEQLTDQKPTNVHVFDLPFAVYRLVPRGQQSAPQSVGPRDFGAQVRGFYMPEVIDGTPVAWTDGQGLLRLPWPQNGPLQVTVQLAGGKRPAALGPARACLSFAPETHWWYEGMPPLPFTAPQCVTLDQQPRDYSFTFDPRGQPVPPTGSLLLQITSETWVPAQYPNQHDQRSLGVQFGGLAETR